MFTIRRSIKILAALLVLFALLTIPVAIAMAVEKAFPPTPPGQIEIKQLPAGVLIEASTDSHYFRSANNLFRPLFRYISDRDIAMTTPVEAQINPARMFFWVAESEVDKVDGNTSSVRVVQMPSRTVASAGGRGSYSESNFNRTREELLSWLADNNEWQAIGDPFAVYWNGPFTLWLLKRYEVQVEVVKTASSKVND